MHLMWMHQDFSEHFFFAHVIYTIQIDIKFLSAAAISQVSMKHEFAISDPLFRRPAKQINGIIRLNLARLKRTTNFISEAIKPTGMLGIKSNKNSFHYFIFAVQMLLLPSSMKTRRQEIYQCVLFQTSGFESPSVFLAVSASGQHLPLEKSFCTKTLQARQRKIHKYVSIHTHAHIYIEICISAQQTQSYASPLSAFCQQSPPSERNK